MSFSDYIAYFDESGDHGLQNIDPEFPVFVLCGCLFKINDYLSHDMPDFSRIKFRHFGHDAVILHSRDIRKRLGSFQKLTNPRTRISFLSDISSFFGQSSVMLISSVIHKTRYTGQYRFPDNPYSISLLFCLERIFGQLKRETGGTLTCVFEQRGETEDNALAAEFARICSGANRWGTLPFSIVFASKLTNMPGLQIADLAAYPIARHVIDPSAANPAYLALEPRFRRSSAGRIVGWGLKIFP